MYSDKVIDHFQNPRNVGEIEDASGVGTVGNAKCGDMMRLYLKINEEQVIDSDIKAHFPSVRSPYNYTSRSLHHESVLLPSDATTPADHSDDKTLPYSA